MKLKDDNKIRVNILNTFQTFWGKFTSDPQMVAILDFFAESPSETIQTAITRHLEDTRRNDRGDTIGKFPPSISDIRANISDMAQKENAEKRKKEEVKIFEEQSPESQHRAAATLARSNWRDELARHQGKRDKIIAHLKNAAGLDFDKKTDAKGFQAVQAALYQTESALPFDEATSIFKAARMPDAKETHAQAEQARDFSHRRKARARPPQDAQAMRSYAPHLAKLPKLKSWAT